MMETGVLLRLLRANWLAIVLLALVGAAAGFGIAQYQPREYTSSAELFVTVSNTSNTGDLAQGSDYTQQQARNYAAVATREIVLDPVRQRLGLRTSVDDLRRSISTNVPLDTSVITVTVTDGDPRQAADIANALAEHLVSTAQQLAPTVGKADTSPVRLQVIERATVETEPTSPNVALLVFLGLLGGLAVSVVVIIGREYVGAPIRTKDQLADLVSASVLGSVRQDRQAQRHPMALLQDGQSGRSEDFRQVRTGLRFLQTETDHKAFVVTSATAGEGKSSVAANVASAIAASGSSVCLVEADLRRPSLGATLDLIDGVGLTTVLAGDAGIDDVLQEWGGDGLQVLLAGEVPPNPSELLESVRTEEVLTAIRDRFDVMIIDSPPLNPVADAAVLARLFGGAIIVAGAKRAKVRDVRRAVERLHVVNARILGAVLNMSSSGDGGYYRSRPIEREVGNGSRRRARRATGSAAQPGIDIEAPEDDSDHRNSNGHLSRRRRARPPAASAVSPDRLADPDDSFDVSSPATPLPVGQSRET